METTPKAQQLPSNIDLLVSFFFPFIGIVIGPIAFFKGQRRRGLSMLATSLIAIAFVLVMSLTR